MTYDPGKGVVQYIDPNGRDSDSGKTPSRAKATFQAAIDAIETQDPSVAVIRGVPGVIADNTLQDTSGSGHQFVKTTAIWNGSYKLVLDLPEVTLAPSWSTPTTGSPEGYCAAFTNSDTSSNAAGSLHIRGLKVVMPTPSETGTGMNRYSTGVELLGVAGCDFDMEIENGSICLYPNATVINTATALTAGNNWGHTIKGRYKNLTSSFFLFQALDCLMEVIIDKAFDDAILVSSGGRHQIRGIINGRSPINGKGAVSGGIYLVNDNVVSSSVDGLFDVGINCVIYDVKDHNSGGRSGVRLAGSMRDVSVDGMISGCHGEGVMADVGANTTIRDLRIGATVKNNLGQAGIRLSANQPTSVIDAVLNSPVVHDNIYNIYTYSNGSLTLAAPGVRSSGPAGNTVRGICVNTESGKTSLINLTGGRFTGATEAELVEQGDGATTGSVIKNNSGIADQ